MLVLGIETSCDECSIALLEGKNTVLGLGTHSQTERHMPYRGVVPELASRLHEEHIARVYSHVLDTVGVVPADLDGIAVSKEPGLRGSLMVGMQFAKGLSLALQKPFVGVNHVEAHLFSAQLEREVAYPHVGVVLSGGHSVLAVVHDYNHVEVRGLTMDDACGECFDKVARELGLPYPGAPELDRLAEKGSAEAASFPRCSYRNYGYMLSYSGLKTAVIHHRRKYWNSNYEESPENIAASFRYAAIEMVIERVLALAGETGLGTVLFGGGVSQNVYLRKRMAACEHLDVLFPRPAYCTDNAAMIAALGHEFLSRGIHDDIHASVASRSPAYKKLPA